ncbi:MAG: Type 1 glutamine amidotransferase-like domain-containing protein [Actinomycetota bacterium]
MKLLLTSAGIKNASIHAALLELLGKPIAECDALCIPTGLYAHPWAGPRQAWRFVSAEEPECPMVGLGWKSVGVLELTALPSLPEARWRGWIERTDVLLCDGGDAAYIAHWLRASGLAELLPTMPEKVWVGLSAGSMVMTPRIGEEFLTWESSAGDTTLGVVDSSIFPHLNHPDLPDNTLAAAERWAAAMPGPAYAIDDETAFTVVGGEVAVVSEGEWKLLRA